MKDAPKGLSEHGDVGDVWVWNDKRKIIVWDFTFTSAAFPARSRWHEWVERIRRWLEKLRQRGKQ